MAGFPFFVNENAIIVSFRYTIFELLLSNLQNGNNGNSPYLLEVPLYRYDNMWWFYNLLVDRNQSFSFSLEF